MISHYFIAKRCNNINLITMSTVQINNSQQKAQRSQNDTQRSMPPNFKSSNFLQYVAQKRSPYSKIRKDKSSIAAFYATPQKSSTIDINNKLSHKSLLQTNLPTINPKHRSQKRSGFVQMWLDEALDAQDGSANKKTVSSVEVEKTGPLKTVQKFQIDKKYLRSQNIDDDVIEKLYNSLYVYTHGINNTFTQILTLTKFNENAEKKIVNNFWRAFTKLLQGCTSYQTAYQVIEVSQNKAFTELKQSFLKKQEEFYQQKKQHQGQINKLNKKISELSTTVINLTNDFKISEATLNMTDEAFNEQVNLRLKFQQKINSVFISYQQIRGKYEKLLTDLKIKGDQFIEIGKMDAKLSNRIDDAMIYIETLQNKLERSEATVRQRDLQLHIRRQQFLQLSEKLKTSIQTKDGNQEEIRKIISKMNLFKQRSEELQCQFAIKNNRIEQLQQRVQQQIGIINECRQANQKIFEKYQICEKEIGKFKVVRFEFQVKLQQLEKEAVIREDKINQLRNHNKLLSNQVIKLQNQLKYTQDDLKLKINCIQKNSSIIDNLRAIKDKSQKLYQITMEEKMKIESKLNEAERISDGFTEEMKGMKMLLENKAVELQEVNVKLQTQRDVFRAKIAGLKEQISTKDTQILVLHDKQLQNQEIVNTSTLQAKRFRLENKQLTDEKMLLHASILQLQTRLTDVQKQQRQHRSFLHQMGQTAESAQKLKKQIVNTLNQKQFLLAQTKKQRNDQNHQLKVILESYREDREKKIYFVHPMIYEDCREQINRLTCKSQELTKEKLFLLTQIDKYKKIIEQDGNKIEEVNVKLNQANRTIAKQLQDKKSMKKTIAQQQNKVSLGLNEIKKIEKAHKQKSNKYEQDVEGQRQKIKKINMENLSHQSTIRQLVETIKTVHKQHNEQIKQFQNQLNLQKEETARLQEEVGSRKIQSSNMNRFSSKSKRIPTKAKLKSSQENQQNNGILSKTKMESQDTHKTQQKVKQSCKISQQVQTDKPKFSHTSKYQTANVSYACQVNSNEQEEKQHYNNPKSPRQQNNEFKRFLKITYMRR